MEQDFSRKWNVSSGEGFSKRGLVSRIKFPVMPEIKGLDRCRLFGSLQYDRETGFG